MSIITAGYGGRIITQGYGSAFVNPVCVVKVPVSSSRLVSLLVSSSRVVQVPVGCPVIETTLKIPRGQTRVWQLAYVTPTNITGNNYTFTARDLYGNILFQVSTQGSVVGIVITDQLNGVLQVTVTSAMSLVPEQEGTWDCWRTDLGYEDQIGKGALLVTESVLNYG